MIQIDIDMPEKCCLCPLFHAERPMYCQGVKADRKKKIVAPYGDPRPEWCPLHEVTADPDAVSREAIYDALGDTRAFYFDSDNGMVQATKDQTGYEGWYKVPDVFQTIDNLPPSPSRPQEHEKSCEGCEWEDSESDGCYHCARHYADFYYEKRNGGAV